MPTQHHRLGRRTCVKVTGIEVREREIKMDRMVAFASIGFSLFVRRTGSVSRVFRVARLSRSLRVSYLGSSRSRGSDPYFQRNLKGNLYCLF